MKTGHALHIWDILVIHYLIQRTYIFHTTQRYIIEMVQCKCIHYVLCETFIWLMISVYVYKEHSYV